MTRAERILHMAEGIVKDVASGIVKHATSTGGKVALGGGLASAGMATARMRQKRDDRVRAAGMGAKLDRAKAVKKKAMIRHAVNPLSKKRKQDYISKSQGLKKVRKAGHKKLDKMLKGTSDTVRGEIEK